MGLPMYRDPDEDVQAIEEAALKLDRAAAARRSTIRREPSVRPGRNSLSTQNVSRFLREHGILRSREELRQQDQDPDSQIAQLQAELERLRRMRLRNRARLNREVDEARAGRQNSTSSSDSNAENDGMTLDSTVEPSDTVRSHLHRPPRESSNLRFEVLPTSTSRSTSPWRYRVLSRNPIPSPPDSAGHEPSIDRSVPDGPLPFDVALPALTEGFAPAQGTSRSGGTTGEEERPLDGGDYRGLETPPPEEWQSILYPPLRRVPHMSPQPLPRAATPLDGLGDRRRSPSPLSESLEEPTWVNLLTTIDVGPDDSSTTAPTTSTSFASTRADSQLGRSRSSQNTATSFGEIGSSNDTDTCDLDLPPGITEEDVREMRARHRPHLTDRMTGRRGLDHHRRQLAEQTYESVPDRISSRSEVDLFRAILDRMQRREEVPDEWWATVGLRPDYGRLGGAEP